MFTLWIYYLFIFFNLMHLYVEVSNFYDPDLVPYIYGFKMDLEKTDRPQNPLTASLGMLLQLSG